MIQTNLRRKFTNIIVLFMFFLSCLLILNNLLVDINNPILDPYGFRQTQTALTVRYLFSSGSAFYATPVLGYPWAIPFEFPFYQLIVGAFTNLFKLEINVVGRFVTALFVFLTLLPLNAILKRFVIERNYRLLFLAIFLTADIYFRWSSSVLIEQIAVFFTISSLPFFLRFVEEQRYGDLLWCLFFLTAGLLQKVTTALPVFIVIAFVSIFVFFNRFKKCEVSASEKKLWFAFFTGMALALLMVLAWTSYTDIQKSKNVFGSHLTASALRNFNFGSLDERISQFLYEDVIYRNIKESSFGIFSVFVLLIGIVLGGKHRKYIILFLLLYVLPFFIFTHLHIVHTYYQLANTIYYLVAFFISLGVVKRSIPSKYIIVFDIVIALLLFINIVSICRESGGPKYTTVKQTAPIYTIADHISRTTESDSLVVAYGLDWTSELAYYSGRKFLMVPDWGRHELDVIENTIKYLNGSPTVIVNCPGDRYSAIDTALKLKYNNTVTFERGGCDVHHIKPLTLDVRDYRGDESGANCSITIDSLKPVANNKYYELRGWGLNPNVDANLPNRFFIKGGSKKLYLSNEMRPDVSNVLGKPNMLNFSGFYAVVPEYFINNEKKYNFGYTVQNIDYVCTP